MLMINSLKLGFVCCRHLLQWPFLLRASGQQMAQLDLTLTKCQGHCSRLSSRWSSSSSVLPWMLRSLHCAAASCPCEDETSDVSGGNPLFAHVLIHDRSLYRKNRCSHPLKYRTVQIQACSYSEWRKYTQTLKMNDVKIINLDDYILRGACPSSMPNNHSDAADFIFIFAASFSSRRLDIFWHASHHIDAFWSRKTPTRFSVAFSKIRDGKEKSVPKNVTTSDMWPTRNHCIAAPCLLFCTYSQCVIFPHTASFILTRKKILHFPQLTSSIQIIALSFIFPKSRGLVRSGKKPASSSSSLRM